MNMDIHGTLNYKYIIRKFTEHKPKLIIIFNFFCKLKW